MIRRSEQIVGSLSIASSPAECTWKHEPTGWLGLVIGQNEHRHQGVGGAAIRFAEKRATRLGLTCLEVGVFEFNENAIRFFLKQGFKKIGIVEKATYWQSKFWPSIHFLKRLS